MATITINDNTKLVLADDNGNMVRYAEVQHGWETGNYIEVPASATPADVFDAYLAN